MSTQLINTLFGISEDDTLALEEEMRPDRVFSGRLAKVMVQVRIAGKAGAAENTENGAACGASADLTSETEGVLGPAEMKHFLRWLADSLDSDKAQLQLQVTGAEEHASLVQTGARRLASQAFA